GDPRDWEEISFPALAEDNDVLGRAPGEPLFTPLMDETVEEAQARWDDVRRAVGSYTWAALYQQNPAPAKGAIFDTDWWRFWTTDERYASRREDGSLDPDGKVILLDPLEHGSGGRWLDS